ncbi:MAG: hypothetical protein ACRDWS_14155 [Acidimicrobiia bacterium]
MNPYHPDMYLDLAKEKIDRYRAEAENHRLTKLARPEGVRQIGRPTRAIGRLASIAEGFKGYRRRRLPAA